MHRGIKGTGEKSQRTLGRGGESKGALARVTLAEERKGTLTCYLGNVTGHLLEGRSHHNFTDVPGLATVLNT